MADTTAQVEQTGKARRSSGGAIALFVVLLALVAAAAFYQEELTDFWRLQGWNTGAVKETMERFVREAYDGQPSAGDLLDPAWAQPVICDGRLYLRYHETLYCYDIRAK